jgi:mRNA interferase MazF
MREGDLVLTPIPQANGQVKNRPVLVLREMPPFHDLLVCGVSSRLHQQVSGFDETIAPAARLRANRARFQGLSPAGELRAHRV